MTTYAVYVVKASRRHKKIVCDSLDECTVVVDAEIDAAKTRVKPTRIYVNKVGPGKKMISKEEWEIRDGNERLLYPTTRHTRNSRAHELYGASRTEVINEIGIHPDDLVDRKRAESAYKNYYGHQLFTGTDPVDDLTYFDKWWWRNVDSNGFVTGNELLSLF